MIKMWTVEEKDFLRNNYDKMKLKEIALKINRSYTAVKKQVQKLGLKCNFSDKRSDINFSIFDNINIDAAYLLGFFMADGYIDKNSIQINIAKSDIEVLEYISQIIYGKKRFSEDKKGFLRFSVTSIKFVSLLSKYNIFPGPKTFNEFLPKGIPEQFIPDFIRGYLDGDGWGSVSEKGNVKCGICSGSRKLLEDFQNYLGFGNIYKISSIWELRFCVADLKRLMKVLYPDERFCLNRKKQGMIQAIAITKHRFYNKLDKQFLLDNLREDNIKEIALKTGRTPTEIRRKGKVLGLIKPIRGKVLCNDSN